MKVENLIQNSPEWHLFRQTHWGASECAAMLGLSSYKTRTELLREKSTGITPEIDAATQRRFDDGHRFEALARPLAEQIIGKKLYPVIGSEGKLSASFDGLTADDSVAFEHKTLSAKLATELSGGHIAEQYRAQMEQQLMLSGAGKCLFMASTWDDANELTAEMHQWYESDPDMRDRLLQGWTQFAIDLENYQHVEHIPAAVATPTRDLPALSIQVQGSISLIDNLSVFGARLNEFVAAINKEPTDDQGFADAEAACKTLQAAQDALEAAEASALSQTASIDEMRKTVKLYADTASTTRLALEKMVKARKESIRTEIVMGGKNALAEHLATLNTRLGKPYMPAIDSDFAGVVKGKKLLSVLRDAVDTELARCKIEANAVADRIQINLNTLRELAKDHAFLFSDDASLVLKPNGDCMDTIKLRIMEHNAAEAAKEVEARARAVRAAEAAAIAKVERERARIAAEEKVKAEREAAAKLAAEEARIRAEVKREADAAQLEVMARLEAHQKSIDEQRAAQTKAEGEKLEELRGKTVDATHADRERAGMPQAPAASTPPILLEERPTRAQLIAMVAGFCAVDLATAEGWLISEFAEEVMKEAA